MADETPTHLRLVPEPPPEPQGEGDAAQSNVKRLPVNPTVAALLELRRKHDKHIEDVRAGARAQVEAEFYKAQAERARAELVQVRAQASEGVQLRAQLIENPTPGVVQAWQAWVKRDPVEALLVTGLVVMVAWNLSRWVFEFWMAANRGKMIASTDRQLGRLGEMERELETFIVTQEGEFPVDALVASSTPRHALPAASRTIEGPRGAQGIQGRQGPQGPRGPGPTDAQVRRAVEGYLGDKLEIEV